EFIGRDHAVQLGFAAIRQPLAGGAEHDRGGAGSGVFSADAHAAHRSCIASNTTPHCNSAGARSYSRPSATAIQSRPCCHCARLSSTTPTLPRTSEPVLSPHGRYSSSVPAAVAEATVRMVRVRTASTSVVSWL